MSNTRDYLLDTNMLGYVAAAKAGFKSPLALLVKKRLDEISLLAGRKIFICAVTVGEVEYGLQIAPTADPVAQGEVRNVLYSFEQATVLSVDQNVAKDSYAPIRASLFKKFADKNTKGRAKKTTLENGRILRLKRSWEFKKMIFGSLLSPLHIT